jgi:hypothetical protein
VKLATRSAMTQPAGAGDAAHSDQIALVLAYLEGDVPSLCAAACVSCAWRLAAADPALWVRLARLPYEAAGRLNAERLASLVTRAAGGLQQLDMSGAVNLTDEGLQAALRQPHVLTSFVAEDSSLTARGVAAVLASRRDLLEQLRVAEMATGLDVFDYLEGAPEHDPDYDVEADHNQALEAFNEANDDIIDALRALMAPGGELDGDQMCETGDGQADMCNRLCGENNGCWACKQPMLCGYCARLRECEYCHHRFCEWCLRSRFYRWR